MPSSNHLTRWLAIPVSLLTVLVGLTAAYQPPVSYGGTGGRPDFRAAPCCMPLMDTDQDGLADVDEFHHYCTNPMNPDTDGDGMTDWWEVVYSAKDPRTGERPIDPLDPTDVYDDPDNDGYDFNHNGYIDGSGQDPFYVGNDLVALSAWKYPASFEYATATISQLLSDPGEHRDKQVRIAGARVVDNGGYGTPVGEIGSSFTINVTDRSTSQQVAVLLQPRSNRPASLNDDASGIDVPASVIDIQGVFERQGPGWRITVRGTERFTTVMEYLAARDYDNGIYPINWTDPNDRDTDGDHMSDGWEVHYGLSPRDPADAGMDKDDDGFGNIEEFLAGTDPRDPSSHPASGGRAQDE